MRYEDNSQAGGIAQGQAPDARDDNDALTAGTKTPADGNVITGEGTKFGPMSSDQADGGHITKLAGAGGVDSSAANGKLAVQGEFGHLTMDAQGNYHYTPKANVPEDSKDVFTYTLADSSGRTDTANLTIEFGKTPAVVRADAQQVVPGPDGVVVLPEGVQLSDVMVVGRNLVINLPDGTQMVIVDGAVFVPQLVLGGVEVPPTNLASLLIDSEPTPGAGTPPPSSGGNFEVPVAPLDPGVPLGDLIPPTEMNYTPPEVEEVFPEVPDDDPFIAIDPGNGVPVINAVDQVSEAGLPTRNGGEPAGSGESADGNGSNNSDPSEATNGTIVYDSPDGVASIMIVGANGVAVEAVIGAVIVGQYGTMTITSVADGVIGYSYVLADNTSGDNTHDDFSVTIVDLDGDSATATLQVNIADDVPDAANDSDAIAAGSYGPATGNVITDASAGDAGDADNGADTLGADGAHVSAVSGAGGSDSSFNADGNLVVNGAYGVLTLNSDGSYTYVRNAGTAGGVNDVFTYTLTDGDGDTSTATLTISIGDSGVTLDAPDAGEAGTSVSELGLPSRGGEPAGSGEIADGDGTNNSDSSETTNGVITFNAPDGPATVTIGGVAVTGVGQVFHGAYGDLTITSYNAATGQIGYSYTLLDNTSGDNTHDDFAIVVIDQDGDSASDTLVIDIADDTPSAVNDTDSLAAGQYGPATGNVITDAEGDGGADTVGADNASVSAVSGAGGSDSSFDGSGNLVVNGQYGVLTIAADGSYSYVRNEGTPGGVSDVFIYTLTDGDGDTASATLTISIADSGVTIDAPDQGEAGTAVSELGLPVRNGGEPAGTGEAADGNGSNNSDGSETTNGVINFNAPDGPATVTIGGVAVTGVGQVFHGAYGDLTITSYNAATGQIGYSYTLLDNTSGDNTHDDFAIVVIDQDGDSASDTLVVNITDDAPIAVNDTDSLAAGEYGPATGNVITDAEGDGGADNVGADNATVTAVSGFGGNDDTPSGGNGELTVNGQYGVLTILADGSYSYVRNPDSPGGVSDVFNYTLTDGDGDTASATLTIDIGDAAPALNDPALVRLDDDVFSGNPGGPGDDVDSAGTPGQLAGTGGDGDLDYFFSGTNTLPAGLTADVVDASHMEISQNGIVVLTITLNNETGAYTVVQNAPIDHLAIQGENNTLFGIGVYAQDADGDTATASINVNVDDDTPLANNDVDTIAPGGTTAEGNVINGDGTVGGTANADAPGADGFGGIVGLSGSGGSDTDATGGFVVSGTYGSLSMDADGIYTYTRADGTPGGVSDVFTYTYVDGDGDEVSATLTINIADATPQLATPGAVLLDDDALAGGNPGGTGDDVDSSGTPGQLMGTGGDGDLDYFFSASQTVPAGFTTNLVNPGVLQVLQGGTVVLTITLNNESGAYSVVQNAPIDHALLQGENNQLFGISVYTQDVDGDTASATLNINVDDDTPLANNDSDLIAAGGTSATGNVITGAGTTEGAANADSPGADGFDGVVGLSGSGGSDTNASGGFDVVGSHGTLHMDANGTYTYTRTDPATGNYSDVFTYTYRDGDGDTVSATLTINIEDAAPQLTNPALVRLDDDALAGGNPGGTGDDVDSAGTPGQLMGTGGDGDLDYFFSASQTVPAGFTTNLVNAGTMQILQGGVVVLTVTLNNETGAYSVVQNAPIAHAAGLDENNILLSLGVYTQDADGDTASATLSINVDDDTPVANDDSDLIASGGNTASGNVITGVGTTEGAANADSPGADGFAGIVGLSGSGGSDTNSAGGFDVSGTYGTLHMDANGAYTYTRTDGTPGDVSDIFTYTYVDGDGDTVSATLTINIDDNAPMLADPAPVLLDDDALAGGNPGGTGDDVDSSGTPGQLMGSGGDGDLDYFFSASQTVPAGFTTNLVNPGVLQVLQGGTVVLTITLDNETGAYSVVQNAPIDHALLQGENNQLFGISVYTQDQDGDTASASLTINVDDDTPVANNDSDTVASGGTSAAGNVITGTGTVEGTANADSPGADGFGSIVGLSGSGSSDTNSAGGFDVVGTYGTLHMDADGSYTYTRNPGTPGGVSDAFGYVYSDGDGDTAVATLTINIADAAPQLADPALVRLDDDALAGGNPGGTDDDVNSAGTPGQLMGSGGDGDLDYFFSASQTVPAGFTTNLVNPGVLQVLQGGTVVLTITLNNESGAYSVVQNAPIDHALLQGENNQLFGISVYTQDVDGDTASATLNINVDDDTPLANNDSDLIAAGGTSATGNVITGAGTVEGTANADSPGADGFDSIVGLAGSGGSDTNAAGGFDVVGSHGTLHMDANGTYTYTRTDGATGTYSDVFTYVYKDGDGDTVAATLTINIEDAAPQLTNPALVRLDDDALAGGNPGGTGDDVDSAGTPGQLMGTGGDGDLDYFFSASQTVPAGFATNLVNAGTMQILQGGVVVLTVTLNNETGAYSVVQNAPIDHAAGLDENNILLSLGVYTQDADGDTASATLSINVDDDTPLANNDVDTIAAGGTSATGNVITGTGTVAGTANADHPGADGFDAIVGLSGSGGSDTNAAGGFTVTGTYGSLQMAADGTYTYTRAGGTPGGVSDTFTYTYQDGDGDTVSATLTIQIGDATPNLATPPTALLDDDAVTGAGGNPGGTGDDVDAQNLSGNLAGSGGDGDLDYFFSGTNTLPAGFTTNFADASTLQVLQGGVVVLTIHLNLETGVYSVEQNAPIDHPAGGDENNLNFQIGFYTQDADGDTASASLTINVDDDTPTLGTIQNQTINNNPAQTPAVGTLHFSDGADGLGSVVITSTTTATSGGYNLVTHQVGNVLTAYTDVNGNGTYEAGTDATAVYTITVNPNAGTSGQYVFDLLTAFDPDITPFNVASDGAFGAGPSNSIIVTNGDTGDNVVYVTGYVPTGGFTPAEITAWQNGGIPTLTQEPDVNGSTQGWGLYNNNFNGGEFLRFDFGALNDYDGAGSYTVPAGTGEMAHISYATFTYFQFGAGEQVQYVVHYSNGTSASVVVNGGAGVTQTTLNAPAGLEIDWVDVYMSSGDIKLNLGTIGIINENTNEVIQNTVTITDGDGDSVSGGFTVNVADGNTPAAPSLARILGFKAPADTSTATNTGIVAGAAAAVGLAAMPLAAQQVDHTALAGTGDETSAASGAGGLAGHGTSASTGGQGSMNLAGDGHASQIDAVGGEPSSPRSMPDFGHEADLAGANAASAPVRDAGPQAQPEPSVPADVAAASGAAPVVNMPSAEALQAAGLGGHAPASDAVAHVVADALGLHDAPTVDGLLAHLGAAAPASQASANDAPVQSWDMAANAASAAHADMLMTMNAMLAVHHDAVQPTQNG